MTHTWSIMAVYHLVFGDWPEGPPGDLVRANQLSSMRRYLDPGREFIYHFWIHSCKVVGGLVRGILHIPWNARTLGSLGTQT